MLIILVCSVAIPIHTFAQPRVSESNLFLFCETILDDYLFDDSKVPELEVEIENNIRGRRLTKDDIRLIEAFVKSVQVEENEKIILFREQNTLTENILAEYVQHSGYQVTFDKLKLKVEKKKEEINTRIIYFKDVIHKEITK